MADGALAFLDAAKGGDAAAVEAFISKRGDVSAVDSIKMSALHWAASEDQANVVRLLVDANAKLDLQDSVQRTALHYAAAKGKADPAKLLIASKADIDRFAFLRTPLHLATHNGHLALVKVLLDGGADSSILDKEGKTALDSALAFQCSDWLLISQTLRSFPVVQLLERAGFSQRDALRYIGELDCHSIQDLHDLKDSDWPAVVPIAHQVRILEALNAPPEPPDEEPAEEEQPEGCDEGLSLAEEF